MFAGGAARVSIDCMAQIHWVTVDCVNTSYTVKITGSLNVVLRLGQRRRRLANNTRRSCVLFLLGSDNSIMSDTRSAGVISKYQIYR